MKRHTRQLCSRFQAAMDVLARPWAGLILCALQERPLRFSELHAQLEVIGDRMLSCRLKELEAEGLVERRVYPEPPIRVEYALTEAGRGFGEVHEAISRWGELLLEHRPDDAVERTCPETAQEPEPVTPTPSGRAGKAEGRGGPAKDRARSPRAHGGSTRARG